LNAENKAAVRMTVHFDSQNNSKDDAHQQSEAILDCLRPEPWNRRLSGNKVLQPQQRF
jgi:hypothetical protein